MIFLLHFILAFCSEMNKELFDNGNIEKALEMDIKEPIDYALKYFLIKQFKQNTEEAIFTALSAPEDNEFILMLTARSNPQNGKLYLPQNVRISLLKEIAERVSNSFYENKYNFRELVSIQSTETKIDSMDVLKNLKGRDSIIIAKFFYYIDSRVYLLKNVINELKYLASKKDKMAYCFLGQAYLTGTGVEKDLDMAFEYFWAGQDGNRAASLLGIGKILMEPEYKNIPGAISAFKLANSATHDAEIDFRLHILTENDKNYEESELLKKAAISGYLPAVQKYTNFYLDQGLNDSAEYSLMSITQYAPFFIKYDEMAFEAYIQKNYKKSCLLYLFLSEFNLKVPIDNCVYLMENHKIFSNQDTLLFDMYKVLSLTNPVYNKKLGDCYFYGNGVEKSLESAFHSYLASKQYSTAGAYCTAYMYEQGIGVAKNLFEAKRIITKNMDRESLYLVKFYSLLRINFKIAISHHRTALALVCTFICVLLCGLRSMFLTKIK